MFNDISEIKVDTKKLEEDLKKKQILCVKQNHSFQICQNNKCQKFAFMCQDQQCLCQQDHENCVSVLTKKLMKSLFNKIVPLQSVSDQINNRFQRIIDSISDLRDKLNTKLNQQFKYFGLTSQQVSFAQSMQKGQVQDLTGKKVWEACMDTKNVQSESNIKVRINKFQQQTNKILEAIQIQLERQEQNLMIQLQKLKNQQYVHKIKENKKSSESPQQIGSNKVIPQIMEKKVPNLTNTIFQGSKVIRQNKVQDLCNFFENRKIRSTRLLYRASQNYFWLSNFHKKCDNVANTITVCQTQFGKVIGGFTPLVWTGNGSDCYLKDNQRLSFVFSLTNNDKFNLLSCQNAIYRGGYSEYGPCFGNGVDFGICEKANENSKSVSNINVAYFNDKYTKYDYTSWQRFHGSKSSFKFKTKEWEVWQLLFE